MDINKYKKINECKKLLEEEDKKNKAIIALQSAIKRKNIEPLIQRQLKLKLEETKSLSKSKSKSKSKLIPSTITASIANNYNINIKPKKNIYPLAPIYKVKELRNHIKKIYEQYPETKKKIKLNASKSDMIKFLDKYNYPLKDVVIGFKPPKKPIGRPRKENIHI